MGETLVRAAQKSDLPALLDLYQHLSPGDRSDLPDAEAIFDQFLAYPGSVIVLCEIGSVLVGSCVLVVIPNLTRGGRPYALIENVVTHGDFRRQGIGKRVLDFATALAWQAGCYKAMLMTVPQGRKPMHFIEAQGSNRLKPFSKAATLRKGRELNKVRPRPMVKPGSPFPLSLS